MSNKEMNEMIDKKDALDFEDEVTTRLDGTEVTPTAEAASADVASDLLEITDEPAASAEPPKEEIPKQYGAPQPLFEDIVPAEFARPEKKERPDPKKEKEAAAAAKKAEKEAEKEAKEAAKRAEKEAKEEAKRQKEKAKYAALIADAESKAVAKAKAEIERDTGEVYDYPEEKPAPAAAQAAPAAAPVVPVAVPAAPANSEKKTGEGNLEPSKSYKRFKKKLRRKYKLDKDYLLSSNDVVPGFVIARGETVIRTYSCLASKKGDGTLCLTNRRLLIDAGERSEIGIDKVSGIKFCKFSRFSFLKFLFWLIFFGLGAAMVALPFIHTQVQIPMITGDAWQSWFNILFYACGAVSLLISLPLFFTMVRKSFYFYVYAREEAPFLEYKSKSFAKREKKGKVYKYMVANAGKESEKAARELGALIIEAKEGRFDF